MQSQQLGIGSYSRGECDDELIAHRQFVQFISIKNINFSLFSYRSLAKPQQIKDKIIEKAKKTGWKIIIERHKKLFVEMSENEVVEMAKR
jgi:hypothetical protein